MSNEKLIKDLERRIDEANTMYWVHDNAQISDSEYDSLVEQLRKLDPDNALVSKIGNDSIAGTKVKHMYPMLSLDKCYSWNELIKWCKSVARSPDELFCLSCKYDGISVEFNPDGRIVTRGDGEVGTDITHLAPWIITRLSWSAQTVEGSMNTLIKTNRSGKGHFGWMTGELLVPTDRFERLQKSYPCFAEYKTPRNLASGFAGWKPDSEMLNLLTVDGNVKVPVCTWVMHQAHELTYPLHLLIDKEDEIVKKLRNYKKCPCDGIVCRLEDQEYGKSLGVTKHHPKSAIALKFKDDEYETVVRDIEWNVANEAITPVAIFDTVDIDGVMVNRATCHNAKFVLDNNLTPGAKVTIVRKGCVIPKIVKVEPVPGAIAVLPSTCPSCNRPATYVEPDLLCTHDDCIGRTVSKICHGLDELGIKGIGPVLVERIVCELIIPDIMRFCLESWDEMLLKAKGFTAHEIHMITSELERVMTTGVEDKVIFASLCIPQASESFAEKVIKYTGDIMTLLNSPEKLDSIPGLNSTALTNAKKFMSEEKDTFEAYYNLFTHLHPANTENMIKVCFTGALPQPRKELERVVLEHGGYPVSNIAQANYLVAADPNSGSSKLEYARKHNIPVISFEELANVLR